MGRSMNNVLSFKNKSKNKVKSKTAGGRRDGKGQGKEGGGGKGGRGVVKGRERGLSECIDPSSHVIDRVRKRTTTRLIQKKFVARVRPHPGV